MIEEPNELLHQNIPEPIILISLRGVHLCASQVLHSLGGNAMAMRSVLPLICAGLSATVPGRLAM